MATRPTTIARPMAIRMAPDLLPAGGAGRAVVPEASAVDVAISPSLCPLVPARRVPLQSDGPVCPDGTPVRRRRRARGPETASRAARRGPQVANIQGDARVPRPPRKLVLPLLRETGMEADRRNVGCVAAVVLVIAFFALLINSARPVIAEEYAASPAPRLLASAD